MIKRAVWVHGNSVAVERSDDLAEEIRIGWGSRFLLKPGHSNWFHVSIPTPVVIDDARPKLARVFVLFKTSKPEDGNVFVGTSIDALHVYDGAKKVRSFDGTRTGEHNTSIDAQNTWEIDTPFPIFSGLGLSINVVDAQVGLNPSPQPVEFATFGADFV